MIDLHEQIDVGQRECDDSANQESGLDGRGRLLRGYVLIWISHVILLGIRFIVAFAGVLKSARYGEWVFARPALTKSSSSCLGMPGSKHRRHRASYMPAAPTTIRSLDSTSRWVCLAGLPQRTQIARVLVID